MRKAQNSRARSSAQSGGAGPNDCNTVFFRHAPIPLIMTRNIMTKSTKSPNDKVARLTCLDIHAADFKTAYQLQRILLDLNFKDI
jgi:hypothetical protein